VVSGQFPNQIQKHGSSNPAGIGDRERAHNGGSFAPLRLIVLEEELDKDICV
jgi:hypothetical protein